MFLNVKGESQKIMVCEPADTLDVIERLCGEDIAQYIREAFNQRTLEEFRIKEELNSDLSSYEASLESDNSAFTDALDGLDKLDAELNKPRLNRDNLRAGARAIRQIIEDRE